MQPPRASAKQTGEPANGGGGKENNAGQRSLVRRTLAKLDTKRSHLRHKLNKRFRDNDTGERSWDNMEYSERQNSVATLDLFKYASRSERLAVLLGVLLMWYAASWQPISVFILAIMASLMGQYSKRISWLLEQNENKTPNVSLSVLDLGAALQAPSVGERSPEPDSNYESFQLLSPLYSIVTPIFELSHEANQSSEWDEDILRHESRLFLRKSFEINGSAFVLALSQLAAFFLGLTLVTWIARRQASRVKVLYFDSCLHQEVTWFEAIDSASGSGSSLNGLVERYEDGIGIKLALLCYFIGHVALFAVSAFCQMFQLASFCMPFVLAVGLIIGYLGERQAAAIGQHSLFAKRSLQLAEEIVAAIRTVFAFNGQQKEITRYGMSLEPVYRRSLMKHLYTALNTSISKFSIFACFACYCFYARRLFPPFQPAPPDKSTVLAVMRGAEVSIVNILISIPFMEALQQAKGSIARIYAAIERRSKIDPAAERGTRPAAAQWQPSISFKMVQFGYAHRSGPTRRRSTLPFLNLPGSPGSNGPEAALPSEPNVVARRQSLMDELAEELPCQQPRRQSAVRRIMGSELAGSGSKRILNYFTLDIRAGQSVALVGPSGSGKSTVLALVQRLYDITGGQLLVGQHNVKDLNVSWLRNQIGVVGQEPRLFDMSIADNIRLGLSAEQPPSKSASMQQVVEAARLASAHDFIQRLPHGYATRVGSGGVQLSGGQKQRIAIARALIRRPKILLLDEATSALDTESEAQVQEALKAASRGRTTLTVAHRLATIRHVDLIVLMNRGQVMECGSHDELMRRTDGLYCKMYLDQLEAVERPARDPPSVDQELSERLLRADQKPPGKLNRLGNFEFPAGEPPDLEQIELDSDSDSDDDNDDQDDDKEAKPKAAAKMKAGTWELWRFLEMPKWSSSLAALVCLLAGLVLPMNLIAHSYLFSAFAYSEPEQLGAYLHLFGVVILSFSFFVLIVTFLQITLPGYVGEKLNIHLRIKTLQALLSKPMFYFDMDANSAGSLCDRFNTHIGTLQSLAGTRVATLLEASSTLAAGAVFGLGQSLSLSLFCLSFALLVLATTIVESRIVERESSLQQKYDAQLAHLMADALSNIKTIATLNKERFFIDKFADIIRQRERGLGRPLLWLRTFLTSLKFVMPAMSWSASMYYGCHLLVEGRIDLQTIFIVCPVVLFAVNDTFRALVFLPELLRARKSIQRLYRMNREFSPEVLQTLTLAQQLEQQNELHLQQMAGLEPGRPSISVVASQELEPADGPRKKKSISFAAESRPSESPTADLEPAPQQQQLNRRLSSLSALPSYMRRKSSRLNSLVPRAQARGRIEFRQVEFAYPNRPSALVLDGLTLSVVPGESVALVGGSGSGKSTCVSILEKFYDYHAGSVTLDGRDLRLMEPSWVRSQIGLVSQEPTLLSYTIGDNIRYGDNSRFVSMDEVVEAARTANIHDFIMSLPDQYDTELSSSVYSSSQLSGGQRQRIAIARALVRNAPILVFDEATSALDSRNETLVQDALSKARKGRTSLTIAHRLATVRDAHKIVVLRDGRAIELGTHEQLMAKPDGHYRALWERQEGAGNVPGEGGR